MNPSQHGRRRTPEEIGYFRRRWEEGATLKILAREMGRTPGAMANAREREKLPVRHGVSDPTLPGVSIRMFLTEDMFRRLAAEAAAVGVSVPAKARMLLRAALDANQIR